MIGSKEVPPGRTILPIRERNRSNATERLSIKESIIYEIKIFNKIMVKLVKCIFFNCWFNLTNIVSLIKYPKLISN